MAAPACPYRRPAPVARERLSGGSKLQVREFSRPEAAGAPVPCSHSWITVASRERCQSRAAQARPALPFGASRAVINAAQPFVLAK